MSPNVVLWEVDITYVHHPEQKMFNLNLIMKK